MSVFIELAVIKDSQRLPIDEFQALTWVQMHREHTKGRWDG